MVCGELFLISTVPEETLSRARRKAECGGRSSRDLLGLWSVCLSPCLSPFISSPPASHSRAASVARNQTGQLHPRPVLPLPRDEHILLIKFSPSFSLNADGSTVLNVKCEVQRCPYALQCTGRCAHTRQALY